MATRTRVLQIVTILLTGAALGVGCGGDDDSGGGDISTGLAASKLLSDVTPQEAEQACENLQSGIDRRLSQDKLVRGFCTLFAAAATESQSECESARDTCIDQASQELEEGGDAEDFGEVGALDCDGESEINACEGTVADFEACMNDTIDQVLAALNSVTCADAGSVAEEDLDGFAETTFAPAASCEALECPVFGEE
jgi:hypothetical protein